MITSNVRFGACAAALAMALVLTGCTASSGGGGGSGDEDAAPGDTQSPSDTDDGNPGETPTPDGKTPPDAGPTPDDVVVVDTPQPEDGGTPTADLPVINDSGIPCCDLIDCITGFACNPASCSCQPAPEDGSCYAFSSSGCAEGFWCEPVEDEPTTGQLLGKCVEATGDAPEGAPCGPGFGSCGQGLICVDWDGSGQACRPYCDPDQTIPTGAGACSDGFACMQLPVDDGQGNVTGVTDYGICVSSCTPWVGMAASGCAENHWCLPFFYNPTGGSCVPADGAAGPGAYCDNQTATTACAPGYVCLPMPSGTSCQTLCYPQAAEGQPGATCATTAGCVQLVSNNPDGSIAMLEIGICVSGCDFHAGIPCPNSSESCVPGELVELEFDTCMAPPPFYSQWPMAEFDLCPTEAEVGLFCGPNSVCLEIAELGGPGLRCYDLCIESAGSYNQSNHPDCRRNTALCIEAFGPGLGFGLCGPDG